MVGVLNIFRITKARQKKLIFPLILAEIIGILVLVWFLRVPLSQKYLQAAPSNYSLSALDPGVQYLLKQGDFISGKAEPNSTLEFWLAPRGIKSGVISDSEGNFSFQIPRDTEPGSYQLIVSLDDKNKIDSFKDLKIRIQSSNVFKLFVSKLIN